MQYDPVEQWFGKGKKHFTVWAVCNIPVKNLRSLVDWPPSPVRQFDLFAFYARLESDQLMREPALPENETSRLVALRELGILDTAPAVEFDRVVALAAEIFQVPIALISLVDDDRQWFKAQFALDSSQTGRDISFVAMHSAMVTGQ